MLPNFSYVRVKSLEEAVKASSVNGTSLMAGGTDLLGCLRGRVFLVDRLVTIGRLMDLKGADTCCAMDGENQYHGIFGSNGACCMVHPSDIAPMLLALAASLRVAGPKGNRQVPVEKFFVLPQEDVHKETVLGKGEIVTAILIPKSPPGLRTSCRKMRVRQACDFAVAGVALALVFKWDRSESGGVVLSGAAPIPWRSRAVEQVVSGGKLDAETAERSAEAAVKGAEPLEYNGYKIHLFRALVHDELTKLARG